MPAQPSVRGVQKLGDDFWNIRGSFKVAGVVEIGTHVSLVRRANGKFIFLDAYALPDPVRRFVDEITDGGQDVEAIVNLHPFHTLHVRKMHALYPNAKLYGTARHVERFGDLPWQRLRSEDPALHSELEDDLQFSVPRGVDFISPNDKVHFSSVLAYHPTSKTIHVDDTLMYVRLPRLVRALKRDVTRFHPTLDKALERRAGAAAEFRRWAQELFERWRDTENLCTAHTAVLPGAKNRGDSVYTRLMSALDEAERMLRAHEKKHG